MRSVRTGQSHGWSPSRFPERIHFARRNQEHGAWRGSCSGGCATWTEQTLILWDGHTNDRFLKEDVRWRASAFVPWLPDPSFNLQIPECKQAVESRARTKKEGIVGGSSEVLTAHPPEFWINFDDWKTPGDISAAKERPDEIPEAERAGIEQHTYIVVLRTRWGTAGLWQQKASSHRAKFGNSAAIENCGRRLAWSSGNARVIISIRLPWHALQFSNDFKALGWQARDVLDTCRRNLDICDHFASVASVL